MLPGVAGVANWECEFLFNAYFRWLIDQHLNILYKIYSCDDKLAFKSAYA